MIRAQRPEKRHWVHAKAQRRKKDEGKSLGLFASRVSILDFSAFFTPSTSVSSVSASSCRVGTMNNSAKTKLATAKPILSPISTHDAFFRAPLETGARHPLCLFAPFRPHFSVNIDEYCPKNGAERSSKILRGCHTPVSRGALKPPRSQSLLTGHPGKMRERTKAAREADAIAR
ncbi:MAG: hypothetical protein ACFUZC_05490 [Chthoniobacteraceae bacterium]